MAAAQADLEQIQINGEPKWHYVSDSARYGFCSNCGAHLFWRNDNNPYLSVTGGSLDDASGLSVAGHIFTAEKGAYYQLPGTHVQHSEWCAEGEIGVARS